MSSPGTENVPLPTLIDRQVLENGVSEHEIELLPVVEDGEEGVIVEMKEPMDAEVFRARLRALISGKRRVWIKLHTELAYLIECSIKENFLPHHAEPSYLMLLSWQPNTPWPTYATHRVGIGAIVLNDKRQILVVQEKSGELRGIGLWKVPTGVVDEGEDIRAAAVREVEEETGIKTSFSEILSFRELHKTFFEKSDLFFVCMLSPLSFDIQEQDQEIEAAQWMSVEEFAAQPFARKNVRCDFVVAVCLARVKNDPSRLAMTISVDEDLPVIDQVLENGHDNGSLPATCDYYDGIIVDMKNPMNSDIFSASLTASMLNWKRQGKKGLWVKLPIELANLAYSAVKAKFQYHHAERSYLMMTHWLPDTHRTLPANATHRVRVAAIVLNDNREVLVVPGRNDILCRTDWLKIPTGLANEGEDIHVAAERVVKQQAGINVELVEILSFRQLHKSHFEKSDLLFLCMLRLKDAKEQQLEIGLVQWMPLDKFAAQPFTKENNLCGYIADVCLEILHGVCPSFFPVATRRASGDPISCLYLNSHDFKLIGCC